MSGAPRGADGADALPLALAGMVALAVGLGVGRFAYTPILPHMLAQAGLDVPGAGWIASANFAGYLLGALLAATSVAARWRRAGLVAGLIASAVTTLAMGLMPARADVWIALRLVSGVASAFVLIGASALVLDGLARRGRPGLSALFYAGVGLGIAVSAVLVDAAARLAASAFPPAPVWSLAWTVLGYASLLAALAPAVILWRAERAGSVAAPAAAGSDAVPPVAENRRALARLIFAYGLFGFGYAVTATFVVAMARAEGLGGSAETAIWILVGLAAAPSVWAWSRVAARFGPSAAFRAALVAEGIGVAATALAVVLPPGGALAALLAGAFLLGATFMGITALGLMTARALAPGAPQRAVGLMTAAFALGQMMGPAVAASLTVHTGNFALASGLAAAMLAGAALATPRLTKPS